MSLFDFNQEELLTFFAVLVRVSTLLVVAPIFGEKVVPASVKILLSIAITTVIFPTLVRSGHVHPGDSAIWASRAGSLLGVVLLEAIFGLSLGFVIRLSFDAIRFGADLIGNLMGLAAASQFDPFQESQTQVVGQFQATLAMLLFLALDGHYMVIQGLVDSFKWVGVGQAVFNAQFAQRLIDSSGHIFAIGLQLAAPVMVCIFAVNIMYGVLAKAMPQMNILVLSFSVSALIGFFVMFMSLGEFGDVAGTVMGKMGEEMTWLSRAVSGK